MDYKLIRKFNLFTEKIIQIYYTSYLINQDEVRHGVNTGVIRKSTNCAVKCYVWKRREQRGA